MNVLSDHLLWRERNGNQQIPYSVFGKVPIMISKYFSGSDHRVSCMCDVYCIYGS